MRVILLLLLAGAGAQAQARSAIPIVPDPLRVAVAPADARGARSLPMRALVRRFAERHGVEVRLRSIHDAHTRLRLLRAGELDLVAAPVVLDGSASQKIGRSVPLVPPAHASTSPATGRAPVSEALWAPGALDWRQALALERRYPGLGAAARRGGATGPASAFSSGSGATQDPGREIVADGLDAGARSSWAVRPGWPGLLEAVNRFLRQVQLAPTERPRYRADLEEIRRRGVLRVATMLSPSSFVLDGGRIAGFEMALLQRFARKRDLDVQVVLADSRQGAVRRVLDGRADVAAASLMPRASWRRRGLAFTEAVRHDRRVVLGRRNGPGAHLPVDLHGKTVVARRRARHGGALARVRGNGVHVTLRMAPPEAGAVELVDGLAEGRYPLVVLDALEARLAAAGHDNVRVMLALGQHHRHVWGVHGEADDLRSELNGFLGSTADSAFYNTLRRRYFDGGSHSAAMRQAYVEQRNRGHISDYDTEVRRLADRHGFDWRLVLALMYHESAFDPEAVSVSGARGLMQLKPASARQVGVRGGLTRAEVSIRAGVRYLAWVRARFAGGLTVPARTWLTLAGYNAGVSRVRSAQRLAGRQGLDPGRWFGHVEQAFRIAGERDARRARKAREVIDYVRAVRERYRIYVELTRRLDATAGRGDAARLAAR